jgi:hypothetical protein
MRLESTEESTIAAIAMVCGVPCAVIKKKARKHKSCRRHFALQQSRTIREWDPSCALLPAQPSRVNETKM